jgi:hypothetical protein
LGVGHGGSGGYCGIWRVGSGRLGEKSRCQLGTGEIRIGSLIKERGGRVRVRVMVVRKLEK